MNKYQVWLGVKTCSGIAFLIMFLIMAILILLFVFHLNNKFHDRDSKLVHIDPVISTAYQKEKLHRFLTFVVFLLLIAISVAIIIAIAITIA